MFFQGKIIEKLPVLSADLVSSRRLGTITVHKARNLMEAWGGCKSRQNKRQAIVSGAVSNWLHNSTKENVSFFLCNTQPSTLREQKLTPNSLNWRQQWYKRLGIERCKKQLIKKKKKERKKEGFIILIIIRRRISVFHFLQYITIIRLFYTLFYILTIFNWFCTCVWDWHSLVRLSKKKGGKKKKAHDCSCPQRAIRSKETKNCSSLCECG